MGLSRAGSSPADVETASISTSTRLLYGVMVNIADFHSATPGSIPGTGIFTCRIYNNITQHKWKVTANKNKKWEFLLNFPATHALAHTRSLARLTMCL
jgi:hypothetical protein